jgi:hypothetical protein
MNTSEDAMSKKRYFVERREQGDYAVRFGGSQRASAVLPTQGAAVDWATERGHSPLVERVRTTDVGHRDQWRKP